MLDREWSRSRFWLCHFLHSRHEQARIDWRQATCGRALLGLSLQRFLCGAIPGQVDDGRWLIGQAVGQCPSDPAYIQALRLFAKEESHLRTMTDRLLARLGWSRRPRTRLGHTAACVRRILGLRFELSMLLQDHLVEMAVFALVRDAGGDDGVLTQTCHQIVACRQAHAAFHAERLTVEFADFNFIRRNLRRLRLRAGFAAKLAITVARHGRLIRAAGHTRTAFVRSAWAAFAAVLERMVPYRREALLAALLNQTQRPYDKPVRLG